MADRELTLKIVADAKGIRVIGDESDKASKKVKGLGKSASGASGGLSRGFASARGAVKSFTGSLKKVSKGLTVVAAAAAGLTSVLAVPFIQAGRQAEESIVRLSAIFQSSLEDGKELFQALQRFSEPLPASTNDLIQSFTLLSSVGLKPTEESLLNITKASLATKRSMEEIGVVLASLEVEPLRRMGISLERTGDTATIAFGNIKKEVENTSDALRAGLIDLFGEAFPNAIELSQTQFDTAVAVMRSGIDILVTNASDRLLPTLTAIVNSIGGWINQNKELLGQGLNAFVGVLSDVFNELVASVIQVIDSFKGTTESGDAIKTTFKVITGFVAVLGQAFETLADIISLAFEGLKSAFNGIKVAIGSTAKFAVDRLLNVANAVNSVSGFFDIDIIPTESLERASSSLDRFISDTGDKLIDNSGQIRERLTDLFDFSVLNTSLAKAFVEIDSGASKSTTTIRTLDEILAQYASTAGETTDKTDKLAKSAESFLSTLLKQIDEQSRANAVFNLSARELVDFETNELKAQAAAEGFGNSLDGLIDLLAQLKKEGIALDETRKQLERLQEVAAKLDDIEINLLPEPEKLRRQLAQQVAAIAALATPDGKLTARINEAIKTTIEQGQAEILKADRELYIERLKASDDFIERVKGGYLEFADSFQDNSEAVSNFFADTLNNMSQNFSDLFYNVLTGKFDNLTDIAKNAFQAILRSFLDMVSAIVTRDIVLNIGANIKSGGITSAGLGGNSLFSLGGLKDSFGALSGLISKGISGIGGLFGLGSGGLSTGILGAVSAGAEAGGAIGALGASGSSLLSSGSSILGTLGSALPAIGIAIGAISFLLPKLIKFFKGVNTSRLGFSRGETFSVQQILDENLGDIDATGVAGVVSEDLPDELERVFIDTVKAQINQIKDVFEPISGDAVDQLLASELTDLRADIKTNKADKLEKKLKDFLEGELLVPLFEGVEESFVTALTEVGFSQAQAITDSLQAEFENIKDTLDKGERGIAIQQAFQEFLGGFAFIEEALRVVVPEFRDEVQGFIEGAESMKEAVAEITDFINQAQIAVDQIVNISNSISSAVNTLNSVNSIASSIGLNTVGGGSQAIQSAIQAAFAGLDQAVTIDQREQLVNLISGLTNDLTSQILTEQQAQSQRVADSQRASIQSRIESLRQENDLIRDSFNVRIEALQTELKLAQSFERLTDSIGKSIDSIIFGANSIFNAVEQTNLLQTRVSNIQAELNRATDPEQRLQLAESLQDAFTSLFNTGVNAFGADSAEANAIFAQVVGGLTDLQDLTANSARSSEEIQAEIEKLTAEQNALIDANNQRISLLSQQASNIQATAARLPADITSFLAPIIERLQQESTSILDARIAQLAGITDSGIDLDTAIQQEILQTEKTTQDVAKLQLSELIKLNRTGAVSSLSSPPQFGVFSNFLESIPTFHGGGVMPYDGLANLQKGELTLTPQQQRDVFSGRDVSGKIDVEIKVTATDTSTSTKLKVDDAINKVDEGMLRLYKSGQSKFAYAINKR